jgi:uncharacterized membrane protein YGL010W
MKGNPVSNIVELMSAYYRYHTRPITRLTHFIGVPAIVYAIQILFCRIPVLDFSLAWVGAGALLIYYLFLDVTLATATAIFLLPLTYLAELTAHEPYSLGIFFVAFIGGWIAQLVGHYHEGKRPALTDNILQIFVAPIFLVAELVFMVGLRRNLQKEVIELASRQR